MCADKKSPEISVGDKDINDIFDNIVLSEERINDAAYEEGYKEGLTVGEREGYHLGYHRGAEIGAEIGYYRGFVNTLQELYPEKLTDKVTGAVSKLKDQLDKIPDENRDDSDLIEMRDSSRTLYKKACSLLKVSPVVPDLSELSY
jgi:hypothetical protein